jgi:hypothetical protein
MRLPRFARNDEKRGGWGLAGKPGNYKNLGTRRLRKEMVLWYSV